MRAADQFFGSPYNPTQQRTTALSSSQSFACNDGFSPLPPPIPDSSVTTGADSDVNSTQNELSRYFGHMSTQSSVLIAELFGSAQENETGCSNSGTIKITVEDDFSHPWGIRGHHVIIKIDLSGL